MVRKRGTEFSTWSVPRCYEQGIRLELDQSVCEERTKLELHENSDGREPPFREDVRDMLQHADPLLSNDSVNNAGCYVTVS
jgi:hypothetical protein